MRHMWCFLPTYDWRKRERKGEREREMSEQIAQVMMINQVLQVLIRAELSSRATMA